MQFISHSESTQPSSRMHLQPHGALNDVRSAVTGTGGRKEYWNGSGRKREKIEREKHGDGSEKKKERCICVYVCVKYGSRRREAEEGVYSHMARIRGVGRNCSTIQRMDRTLLGTPLSPSSPCSSTLLRNHRARGAARRKGGWKSAGRAEREREERKGEKRTTPIN